MSPVICSPLMNVFMDLKCSPLAVAPFEHAKLPRVLTGSTLLNTHFYLTQADSPRHESNPIFHLSSPFNVYHTSTCRQSTKWLTVGALLPFLGSLSFQIESESAE